MAGEAKKVKDNSQIKELAKRVLELPEKEYEFGLKTFAALNAKVDELREHNALLRRTVVGLLERID
jgi:hypothetical protein